MIFQKILTLAFSTSFAFGSTLVFLTGAFEIFLATAFVSLSLGFPLYFTFLFAILINNSDINLIYSNCIYVCLRRIIDYFHSFKGYEEQLNITINIKYMKNQLYFPSVYGWDIAKLNK